MTALTIAAAAFIGIRCIAGLRWLLDRYGHTLTPFERALCAVEDENYAKAQAILTPWSDMFFSAVPYRVSLASHMCALGAACVERGKWKQAKVVLESAVEAGQKLRPKESLVLGHALSWLARVHQHNAAYEQAKAAQIQALTIYKNQVECDETIIAISFNDLATIFHDLGEWKEAEKNYSDALKILTGMDPPDPIEEANTNENLARLWWDHEQPEKAARHLCRAISLRNHDREPFGEDMRREALIDDHYRLAWIRGEQSRHEEAADHLGQVVELQAERDGDMSKEVAHTLQHLGEAHRAARRHDDAKQAHSRSLEIFETFGPEMAVEESDALHCLALVFHDEGEFEEAERYYNLALNRILEAAVNDRSIEAKIRRNLGSLKLDEQCFEEAERYLLGALDVKRGANDGATVDPIALILLARTAAGQCEPDDAIHYYRRAIEALEVTTGLVHRDLIEPLQELSGVLADVGRHDEAAILRGQAEAILGDEGTSPVLH